MKMTSPTESDIARQRRFATREACCAVGVYPPATRFVCLGAKPARPGAKRRSKRRPVTFLYAPFAAVYRGDQPTAGRAPCRARQGKRYGTTNRRSARTTLHRSDRGVGAGGIVRRAFERGPTTDLL